ncbi:cytochrome P450 81F3-like [Olea europaea subsp. europaea]|uniref:(+)-piperitol/(+)-sesamin synthase n=1 Tax=Olea europaea subsp. europaea TaxID=158383 RepID=A0A8S0T333_OLEEU|nr:cytochrome P450 81F3-like [Olea europaea subsp. europaea]
MDTLRLFIPFVFILYIITEHFFNKLRNLPPSPILNLPIIGHLYLLKKPIYRSLAKISDSHGPILLLQFGSRRVLVVSSPSAAEDCLSKNDIVFANRPRLIAGKHIGSNYTSVGWASYGDHWRNLRRISSIELLSNHRLQLLQHIRMDEVNVMLKRLYRASESHQTVDMKTAFFELTMNVMMRMIAGKRYYGENVEDIEAANLFREIVVETFQTAGTSNMADYLPVLRWLGDVGGYEKIIMMLQKKREMFMQELVEEWKRRMGSTAATRGGVGDSDAGGKERSMIEVLLTLQDKESEYYTDSIIRNLMLGLLVAGTDTSSGTMEWALSLLLNNPQVLKKAQNEIDNHIGHERLMDESDIVDLPYLRCIVNETMRMYPVAPLLVPHESSDQSIIGGYHVPKGTILLVNAWSIQNDPKIWKDPRKFKPERFEGLEGTTDGLKLLPFGFGRRRCPGEGLALRIVQLVLGSIIQCFDWERVGKEMVDMTEGFGLTTPKAQPLMAKCNPRPVAAKLLFP